MEETAPDIRATAYQLRLRLDLFAEYYALEIEQVANEIINNTDDLNIKQNALIWKMYAIPAGYNAIFLKDPLAANYDIWALCVQMTDYFESGIGKNRFGPMQKLAIQVSKKLEDGIYNFAKTVSLDTSVSAALEFVNSFTDKYPLTNHYFSRASTMELFAEILGSRESNLTGSIGEMEQTLSMVNKKLSVYLEFLPKQARWQAEYLFNQMMIDQKLGQTVEDFRLLRQDVDQLTQLAGKAPFYMDSLSKNTLLDINRQREATLDFFRRERENVLNELRNIILTEIDHERKAALEQIDQLAVKSIDHITNQTEEIINRLLLKVFLGLLVIGLVFFLILRFYHKS